MDTSVKNFELQYERTKAMALQRLSEIYLNKATDLIAYKALEAIGLQQQITIGKGVKATKTHHDNNHLVFRTLFEADGIIENHEHDCIELVLLINGALIDLQNENQKIDEENPCYVIPPHTPHCIAAFGKKAVADVVFKNPETLTTNPLDVVSFLAKRGFEVDENYVDKKRFGSADVFE